LIRIKIFELIFINIKQVDIVSSVKEALNFLCKNKYDIIFLDHDLDDRAFVDSNEANTGYQVAKELKNTINASTQCILHTMNSIGAKNMLAVLNKATYIPFHILKESITLE
jgi:hypothetical protein